MKKILTTLLILVVAAGFAQTSTATHATTTTTSSKSKPIVNSWSLYQTETFNAVHAPTDQQKGDLLLFSTDGSYRWIRDGVTEYGKYQANAACTEITLSASNGGMKTIKVLSCTASELKIDYKDESDIHNILYYKSGTTATTGTTQGK